MLTTFIAALAALSMQSAADVEASCKAYQAEHGGETDCACVGKLVAADKDLLAELMTIEGPEDLAKSSDKMKMTLKACSPKPKD